MSEKSIDDVTPDTDVTGVEKLPVSDGGTPKSVTIEKVKDFVLAKINALSAADAVTVANDGVFIKQNGSLKPVAAETLAAAIVAYAFGQEAPSALAATDEVVISKSGVTHATTLSDLASYFKTAIELDAFNIDDLEELEEELDGTYWFALCPQATEGETVQTYKINTQTLANYLSEIMADELIASPPAAYYVIIRQSSGDDNEFKCVDVRNLPFGDGDVKGPSANTNGKIPQWDGTNSKTLKNGLTLASSVTSTSASTEVPNALAVWNLAGGKVTAPSANTDGKIPQWDGTNSKTLKDGLAFGTTIGETTSDAKLIPEKTIVDKITADFAAALESGGSIDVAITTAITAALESGGEIRGELDACAKSPSSTTSGYVPVWSSTSKTLDTGKSLVTSVSSSSTDNQIPTAKAVNDAISSSYTTNLVKMTSSTTQGQIPKWSSTSKTFDSGGYSVVQNEIASSGSTSEIPTTRAVMTNIHKAVAVQAYAPSDGQTGYQQGQMIYNSGSTNPGLYINVGTSVSAVWARIAPAT